MTDRKAMEQALEALENGDVPTLKNVGKNLDAITALRERLAQPEREPVYWQWRRKDQPWSLEYTFNSEVQVTTKDSERRPLYTTPPQRNPWVGLTEDEIDAVWVDYQLDGIDVARAIEAKLKEKNT